MSAENGRITRPRSNAIKITDYYKHPLKISLAMSTDKSNQIGLNTLNLNNNSSQINVRDSNKSDFHSKGSTPLVPNEGSVLEMARGVKKNLNEVSNLRASLINLKDTAKTKRENAFEEEVLNFTMASQEIENTLKNILNLNPSKVFQGITEKDKEKARDDFVAALKEVSENHSMDHFIFNGQSVSFQAIDRKPIAKLSFYFQGPESSTWKEALLDYISSQLTDKDKIHIPKPFEKAILERKNDQEVSQIASLLMSLVCEPGTIRKLDIDKFKKLLNDPRIVQSPSLTQGVYRAGKNVALSAIRHAQDNIVWDNMRVVPPNRETQKRKFKEWQEARNQLKEKDQILDIEGIKRVAKTVQIEFDPNKKLSSEGMEEFVTILNKVNELMSHA